jgi:hypothetical protein
MGRVFWQTPELLQGDNLAHTGMANLLPVSLM